MDKLFAELGYAIVKGGRQPSFNFSDAEAVYIHCFDGRRFWKKVWRSLFFSMDEVLSARIPMAGSSASPEAYKKYLIEHKATPGIVVPVISHWPCGLWKDFDSRTSKLHGLYITTSLLTAGFAAFSLHLHLDETKGLQLECEDPLGYTASNQLAKGIFEKANSIVGIESAPGEMEKIKKLRLIGARQVFGAPTEADIMIICSGFGSAIEFTNSLEIAQEIQEEDAVEITMARQFINVK